MIIYKTTNRINGKIYIGYDTKEDSNYLGSGVCYKRAEKKYGKENFRKAIIDSDEDFKALCLKETFWIDFYDARNPKVGYNISEGGKGGDNFTKNPRREKIREKITAATKLAMKNPAVLAKMQRPKSEEHKRKMSEVRKGVAHSHKSIPPSAATKCKLSEITRAWWAKKKNTLQENTCYNEFDIVRS